MKKRFGVLMFVLGGGTVAVRDWAVNRHTPYLDKRATLELAMDDARAQCQVALGQKIDVCRNFRLKRIDESKDGWTIEFVSMDGHWTDSAWIGRRGEYDALGGFRRTE